MTLSACEKLSEETYCIDLKTFLTDLSKHKMRKIKVTFNSVQYFIIILLSTGLTSCGEKINITPPPITTEPPVSEIKLDYKVWINGIEATVYEARVQDPPWEKEEVNLDFGGNYSFASFEVDKSAEIKIESESRSLTDVVLFPVKNSVSELTKSDNSISFKIEKPMQLIIEPDGKKSPLLLFANPVEDYNPNLDDPDLIYYGPGLHHPAVIRLKSNQTLYIDEGAVVHAGVYIEGENITVRGPGIICGNDFVWGEYSRHLIEINKSSNVVVKDVVLRGSAAWTMIINRSKNILVNNVKVVGGRAQNDDGMNPVNSKDVQISNCFIRTDDDCIALKGFDTNFYNVERIAVENCILWCDRARIFLLGHESRAAYMRDLTFRNIDIVHFSMTPFLLEPGEEMRLENVVFEDIRLNGEGQNELIRLKPVINQYMETKVPGHINNITFKNISVTGKPGPYKIQLMGADEAHSVRNVNIENMNIFGREVKEDYNNLEIGEYVHDIKFL